MLTRGKCSIEILQTISDAWVMKTYSFRSVEYNFPYVLDVILPSLGFLNEKAFSDTEQFDPPSLKLEKEYKI